MDPLLIFRIGVFILVTVAGIAFGLIIFQDVNNKRDLLLKSRNIIDGISVDNEERKKREKKKGKKEEKEKKIKGIKEIYEQYVFFYEPKDAGKRVVKENERRMLAKAKLLKIVVIGYISSVTIYFLLTANWPITLILSPLYIVGYYFFLENTLKKKRIKYIKSFTSSLDIISSSVQAGNSLEEGIKVVSRRGSVMPEMKQQFVILNNHIKSSITMSEALELFGERNKAFEEFSMFVVVMQFFIKTGGKNLDEVFETLQKTLNQKVENYSIIESKLATYEYAFNFFVFAFIGISILAPFFIRDFYQNIVTDPNGILGVFAGVFLMMFSVWMFKTSVKSAAEA